MNLVWLEVLMLAYAFIYTHSLCVCVGSEGSDETACMRSYIQALASYWLYNKYQ